MSPLDVPMGLAAVIFAVGCIAGVLAFYGACALIERWRR